MGAMDNIQTVNYSNNLARITHLLHACYTSANLQSFH
jgi:hypothetical protein